LKNGVSVDPVKASRDAGETVEAVTKYSFEITPLPKAAAAASTTSK